MLKDLLHTVLTGGTTVGLTTTLGPLVSLMATWNERSADPVIRFYMQTVLRSAGVRHEARGLEELPPGQCVFVCNHQSHFDAPLIFSYLSKHTRFVAKSELFDIPIFGRALRRTGNIRVERTGGAGDRQAMEEAIATVRERTCIMFFAEGSRSDDGVLRPFKKGAAVLALQAQVPLVPLAVIGTRHILPKGSAWIRGGRRALLLAGKPIPTEGLSLDDRDRVIEAARDAVAALLAEGQAELGVD